MAKIDDLFNEEKEKLENLEVPDDLEKRLRIALNRPKKKKRFRLVAVILLGLLFCNYNFDAIAFYGKSILGFETVMEGNLNDLNKRGHGQVIEKSYEFTDGKKVTLNGVMMDDNRLIAFYTIENENKDLETYARRFEGEKGVYEEHGGYGEINEEENQVKWVVDYETPKSSDEKLSFTFSTMINGKVENGKIDFTLDKSKAMGYKLKKNINQKVKINGNTIYFDLLVASPTLTVIEGSIGSYLELLQSILKDQHTGFRFDYDVLVNGKILEKKGSGISSNLNGITFEGKFAPLPEKIEKLEIRINKLTISKTVDRLEKISQGTNFSVLDNDIEIKDIYYKNGNTYITISTEEDVRLEKVYLKKDNEKIHLERTINEDLKKKDGKIINERTLEFKGKITSPEFLIKRIRYAEKVSEKINIPLN